MPETTEPAAAAAPAWPAGGLTLETALAARVATESGPGPQARSGRQQRPGLLRWRHKPWGLRSSLWLLLAIGLLPALAGTAWYLHQLRQLALRDAFAQADLMANGTAEALRWQVQDAQAMLTAVASRAKVRALDAADCDAVFRDVRVLAPAHKTLALRRSNGDAVCAELQRPPPAANVAAAPWFQPALAAGGFHVSGVHMGELQQDWTVRVTLPVRGPTGLAEGLLVAPLDLQQLQQRLFARMPPQARVAVVDGSNRVVVHSQLQQERVGKPAVAHLAREFDLLRQQADGPGSVAVRQLQEDGFDGSTRLFVLRPVPLTDWAVVASLPETDILQGYRDSRDRTLAAVLLVLLGVAAAAWRVGRSILAPMRGLKDAARGVAAGDDSRRAPETGPREIATVGHEFNRMVLANSLARAQLHASERHYRTLLQNLPVAVVTHRPDSAIEIFNDRACSLLRMRPAQLQGSSMQDQAWHFVDARGRRLPAQAYPANQLLRSHQPLAPMLLGIVGGAAAAAASPADAGADTTPTAHTWVMVTGYPQFDSPGVLQRAVVVFVDVTAQRQAEALRLARDTAEAASQAKSVFLSRVSHELRTPLNAINGFSELVLMDEQVPPASKDKIRHVLTAGQHLLSLINQVLDLTQVEAAGPITARQPLALWPLLQDCLDLCSPLAQARGVRLAPAPPPAATPWVLGAATPVRQVLINLLSNAIKYNRADGQVDIGWTWAADGETVQLHIRDTGPGLSAAQQAALFQPFNRLGAEFSSVEGHGLGLSIARMLAQSMGGDISQHSVAGQGATFTLTLQRCAAP